MVKESLFETLAWQPAQKQNRFAQAIPGDFAPTWSWTRIDRPISYQTVHAQNSSLCDAQPFVHDPNLLDADAKSRELIVEGKLVPAAFRTRQELGAAEQRTSYEPNDNAGPGTWLRVTAYTQLRPCLSQFLDRETALAM